MRIKLVRRLKRALEPAKDRVTKLGRPTLQQIEELRRKANADLAANEGQPLPEKVLIDLATLQSKRATKH